MKFESIWLLKFPNLFKVKMGIWVIKVDKRKVRMGALAQNSKILKCLLSFRERTKIKDHKSSFGVRENLQTLKGRNIGSNRIEDFRETTGRVHLRLKHQSAHKKAAFICGREFDNAFFKMDIVVSVIEIPCWLEIVEFNYSKRFFKLIIRIMHDVKR